MTYITDTKDTYWAVVRNQQNRSGYLEISDLGNGKWGVVLDDTEFTIKTTATDFWEILSLALARRDVLLGK